ncbi:3'-5' exonuclease [Novosphingobium sp. ST904]|uniref:3'-5' exonuclease n=1 Tax=Novosphingobium sp. ST904 TaxID=1684385 RepID=UPI0006C8660D|nr:3'-5' exonuclease [Novosphingobium sp. ST904]KPH67138.1 DNA polymerase III subunit epsilon [Novosphingobium sp. ST904]
MHGHLPEDLARAARTLNADPNFRVLRRLAPVNRLHAGPAVGKTRIGVALDVETTGLDRETDKIIELAVQRFRFDELGHIVQVGTPRTWREDPHAPIDPHITKLTGLTSIDLEGQAIDEAAAIEILASSDIIIAHNAAFDRPFVDRRLPGIAGRPWACSMAELDWLELGFDGRALGYLLSQCGWFYEGHRAENDILALIYLLGHTASDGGTILTKLIESAERTSFRVNAVDAPFEGKDSLKARGYRWDAALRFWWKTIPGEEVESEREWLLREIYTGHGEPAFHPQSACDRYR